MKAFLQQLWIFFIALSLSACNGGGSSHRAAEDENKLPIADAGADLVVDEKQLVTLDGSASRDPDWDKITFKWVQLDGPHSPLSSDTDDSPSFIAPDGNATLVYQLLISDGEDSSIPDTVTITVVKTPSTDNNPDNDDNTDSGNGSSDPGTDTGSDNNTNTDSDSDTDSNTDTDTGSDTNNNTGSDSNNNPDSNTDNGSDTGNDSGSNNDSGSDNDPAPVPENTPPVSHAGEDKTVSGNSLVSLDSSMSYDNDNDELTYLWSQTGGPTLSLNDTSVAFPSFVAPNENATYIFSLIVSDQSSSSEADSVSISVNAIQTNQAPIAFAGTDQQVNGNDLVVLNGDSSSDPEGSPLSFTWQQISGPNINLTSANQAQASFIAPEAGGDIELGLTVNDGEVDSASDTILISVQAVSAQLTANAGDDQSVKSNSNVTLDASNSSHSNNLVLSYSWRQTGGPGVILSSVSSMNPEFTAPATTQPGETLTLSFSLVVSDGVSNSASDTVLITVDNSNTAPVADAGLSQSVEAETTVILDGSASSDPDNDLLSYAWSQISGTNIELTDGDSSSASFLAPAEGGEFQFSLVVNDGLLNSEPSITTVTVFPANNPPIANAGVDRYVGSLSIVALKGSRSSDPDGDSLTFSWSQLSGPSITLSNKNASNPTFEAHTDGKLVFSLIVNDGNVDSEADTVTVNVGPIPATNIKVNGTGITWGANYPTGNNQSCTGEAIDQQDCSLGRELTHNDDSNGRAGFDFTKVDEDGVETDASDPEWQCVQDAVTGLMWEVKTEGNGTPGDEGLNDADDRYSWYNTDASSNGGAEGFADSKGDQCYEYDEENPSTYCNSQDFVKRMNEAGWCGYADWRLPSRKELLSIVDYGNTTPMIDNDYFPSSSALTWTSAPFALGTSSAWGVNFGTGNSYSLDKRNSNQIRLVRGGYE